MQRNIVGYAKRESSVPIPQSLVPIVIKAPRISQAPEWPDTQERLAQSGASAERRTCPGAGLRNGNS